MSLPLEKGWGAGLRTELVQSPAGQVSGRGPANLVLVTKGKGDRSLIHLPDRSPLPSRARRREVSGLQSLPTPSYTYISHLGLEKGLLSGKPS